MPYIEITEVVLAHCNIVNNNYLQDSRALYKFILNTIPNKLFSKLLNISPTNYIFLITFNSEFFIYWIMIYYSKF